MLLPAKSTAGIVQLLLLLLSINSLTCRAQSIDTDVCTETTESASLPTVPASYHASMLISVPSGAQFGQTSIMRDSATNRSAVTVQLSASEEFKAILDSVTNQILVINHRAEPFDILNCQVQNASSESFTALMTKVSFLGGERIIPTGEFFIGKGLKIKQEGTEQIGGQFPANKYRTCHYSRSLQTTMGVTWWFSTTTQAPVQATVRYKPSGSSVVQETTYSVGPLRSGSEQHDATRHPFTAPKGVYCKGLVSAKQAPTTYDRFSLVAERYMYNLPGVDTTGPDSFRESYDLRANVSMIEGNGITNTLDKTKYGRGILARINDFTRGISYVKNVRLGNCSYERIPENEWDSSPSPNGVQIRLPDQFYFPSRAELQYKGSGIYRSKPVDVYIGFKDNYLDLGNGNKYPLTAEYYLDIKLFYDGTGQPAFMSVPLGVYSASSSKYNAIVEVVDFDSGVPRAFDHDISDCFLELQKQHFELAVPLLDLEPGFVQYIQDYPEQFIYAMVNSLSKAINISPLRILNPKIDVTVDGVVIVVEITVSDRVDVPGYTPKLPEIPLGQVASAIGDLVSKKTLVVDVMEGDMIFQVPVSQVIRLDNRSGAGISGMSPGAIAGLSIGMIVLGILLGLAIAFAVGYFRKDSSPFGFKPFGGPSEAAT